MPDINIIEGGFFSDVRGSLAFVNSFDFNDVRRFYNIVQHDTSIIRAWQGHKVERKYFYVSHGSFLLAWVKIDDWEKPSINLKGSSIILSADKPKILSVPAGYANGMKALIRGSVLTVYSNLDLQQSEKDRWSFDSSLWLDWASFNA